MISGSNFGVGGLHQAHSLHRPAPRRINPRSLLAERIAEMPWTAADATKFTHFASDASLRRLWASTANGALKSGKDDGEAVRIANAAVHRASTSRKSKKRS